MFNEHDSLPYVVELILLSLHFMIISLRAPKQHHTTTYRQTQTLKCNAKVPATQLVAQLKILAAPAAVLVVLQGSANIEVPNVPQRVGSGE